MHIYIRDKLPLSSVNEHGILRDIINSLLWLLDTLFCRMTRDINEVIKMVSDF